MSEMETTPENEYLRLLHALNIEGDSERNVYYVKSVSELLDVTMSLISDCVRRGCIVTPSVLNAAKEIGVNPKYVKDGKSPVLLDGYEMADRVAARPKRIYN